MEHGTSVRSLKSCSFSKRTKKNFKKCYAIEVPVTASNPGVSCCLFSGRGPVPGLDNGMCDARSRKSHVLKHTCYCTPRGLYICLPSQRFIHRLSPSECQISSVIDVSSSFIVLATTFRALVNKT